MIARTPPRLSFGIDRLGTRAATVILAILAACGSVSAENWPEFRGPTHQGVSHETGLPLHWGPEQNVAWTTEIPGEAWSSPIVWEDRVFVTTTTDDGTVCRVLALNRDNGGILWNREVFRQELRRKENRNSYATPTPATDGERVYACFGGGSFVALDWDGQVVWVNRDYPFYSQHGLGTSLVLHDGLLIMARDGSSDGEDPKVGWQIPWDQSYVLALDAETGEERWKTGRGLSRIAHGTPTIRHHNGQMEIVSEAGDVVQGFDPQTGERLWSVEVLGEGKVPSPVVAEKAAGDLVFTSGGWGGNDTIKAFQQTEDGQWEMAWEERRGMPKVPSLVYLEPYLYAVTDGGIATCIEAASGEVVWQERLEGKYAASPVAADGRIYFLSDNAETVVIEAGPEFRELARNPLHEPTQASPAVSNGRLFIRTQRHLYCIGDE